jgi:hypothetical protein
MQVPEVALIGVRVCANVIFWIDGAGGRLRWGIHNDRSSATFTTVVLLIPNPIPREDVSRRFDQFWFAIIRQRPMRGLAYRRRENIPEAGIMPGDHRDLGIEASIEEDFRGIHERLARGAQPFAVQPR